MASGADTISSGLRNSAVGADMMEFAPQRLEGVNGLWKRGCRGCVKFSQALRCRRRRSVFFYLRDLISTFL